MGKEGEGGDAFLARMIPAGDFVLNASLVPGRLTYHLDPRRLVALVGICKRLYFGEQNHIRSGI